MALDTKNGSVYLSAAALGPLPMPAANNRKPPKHPTAVAGTFHVLVASPAASRESPN